MLNLPPQGWAFCKVSISSAFSLVSTIFSFFYPSHMLSKYKSLVLPDNVQYLMFEGIHTHILAKCSASHQLLSLSTDYLLSPTTVLLLFLSSIGVFKLTTPPKSLTSCLHSSSGHAVHDFLILLISILSKSLMEELTNIFFFPPYCWNSLP